MENSGEPGTQAKILAAAEEVFMRDGFDGARMQVIAETAGINKALLHYYFRSKQRLFEEIVHKRIGTFLPKITASLASKTTVEERIEAFIDAYLKLLTANPHLPMFVLLSIHKNPAFVKNLPRQLFEQITAFFKAEMAAGRMKKVDPSHFLLSIVSMCIFPFVARNLARHMMGKTEAEYAVFLSKRKSEIMRIVKSMLLP